MGVISKAPWTYLEDSAAAAYSNDSGRFSIRSCDEGPNDGWVIATTIGDVAEIAPFEEANARLIAAAPDLLRELEKAEDCLRRSHYVGVERDTIRAAIKKAKGE